MDNAIGRVMTRHSGNCTFVFIPLTKLTHLINQNLVNHAEGLFPQSRAPLCSGNAVRLARHASKQRKMKTLDIWRPEFTFEQAMGEWRRWSRCILQLGWEKLAFSWLSQTHVAQYTLLETDKPVTLLQCEINAEWVLGGLSHEGGNDRKENSTQNVRETPMGIWP